jgi:glyoxylase-like metal-dependent hydrolase (beta-lactamase superfamily II)
MSRRIVGLLLAGFCLSPVAASAQQSDSATPTASEGAYPPLPSIIGVRNTSYADIPAGSKGAAVDPAKGYRLQDFGDGPYLITDNQIQSMFLVYDRGVVVMDVPQNYATKIPQAIAEVTDQPITHVIYSHSHADHIGGTKALGGHPIIIAQEETLKLLKRAADPNRPLPTVTFKDHYTLRVGKQTLELSYHGDGHEPGNIFIYAPAQKVLMAIDLVFPSWMMWRRFAIAHDVPGVFAQVDLIRKMDWQTIVGGHVTRTGTHADVEVQAEWMRDVRQAAAAALASTKPGEGMDPKDKANPWALFDNYIDRVATKCVNAVTPKWTTRLARSTCTSGISATRWSRACGSTTNRHLRPLSLGWRRRYE